MNKKKYPSKRHRGRNKIQNNPLFPLLVILGGIVLLLGGAYKLWESRQSDSQGVPVEVSGTPSLRVDRELVDLGDVPLNKMVTVSFQVSNAGDQTLRFSKVPSVEVREGC